MAVGFLVWDPNFVRDADGTKVGRWVECHADSLGRLVLSPNTTVSLDTSDTLQVFDKNVDARELVSRSVLEEILTEIKINNTYLQSLVGEKLTECDVED